MFLFTQNGLHILHASLGIYGDAFFKMGLIGLAAAVIGFAVSPWLKRVAGIK